MPEGASNLVSVERIKLLVDISCVTSGKFDCSFLLVIGDEALLGHNVDNLTRLFVVLELVGSLVSVWGQKCISAILGEGVLRVGKRSD